jgi:hypothetical protein
MVKQAHEADLTRPAVFGEINPPGRVCYFFTYAFGFAMNLSRHSVEQK